MKLESLRHYSHTHHLQSCQTLAAVTMEDSTVFVGVYDSSNGHWLSLPEFEEVGYLSDFLVGGVNRKAAYIEAINGGALVPEPVKGKATS